MVKLDVWNAGSAKVYPEGKHPVSLLPNAACADDLMAVFKFEPFDFVNLALQVGITDYSPAKWPLCFLRLRNVETLRNLEFGTPVAISDKHLACLYVMCARSVAIRALEEGRLVEHVTANEHANYCRNALFAHFHQRQYAWLVENLDKLVADFEQNAHQLRYELDHNQSGDEHAPGKRVH